MLSGLNGHQSIYVWSVNKKLKASDTDNGTRLSLEPQIMYLQNLLTEYYCTTPLSLTQTQSVFAKFELDTYQEIFF